MTFYYKLQYSDCRLDDITDEVIFLGNRFTLQELEMAADTLTACYPDKVRDVHDIKALISFMMANDHHHIIDEVLNGYRWLIDGIIPDYYQLDVGADWPGGFHDFTIISKLLDEAYLIEVLECVTHKILDLISDDMDILKDYLSGLGYKFGTVGYSNWSYYIAAHDDESYFRDLWERHNFYTIIEHNDKGELVDSLDRLDACYSDWSVTLFGPTI